MNIKTVGKRKPASGWREADRFLKMANELRKGRPFYPRGVYRFTSHEKAQEWSLRMITRKQSH